MAAWDKKRLFRSEPKGSERSFTIVIPPPNVTGALHLGHALNNVIQDVLIRWHKLLGVETCWVPGTDHGGIATQNVMEKQFKAENLTRHKIGREKFVERMQAWTRDCKKTILGQLKALGCALDWEREAFTMDAPRAKSVFESFKRLWEKDLVYSGERMVNWCVRCGTALSDIEVEHEERKGHLWHIHYPLADGSTGLEVATTRPETMLGDTAVAVNPKDSRYVNLVGKKLRLPLMEREISVVADEHVDSSFGTGAVKVTPAHDVNDFEIGQRHGLPSVKVIGPDGKMTEAAGAYQGLSRELARDKVVADLKASALLRKVEDHRHSVGVCYRCGAAIEPLLSYQWFVRMAGLAKGALEAHRAGYFRIHPESWSKPYSEWLGGIKDWCISRQIWWGHRIPIWYCVHCAKPLMLLREKIQMASGKDASMSYHADILMDEGVSLEEILSKSNGMEVPGSINKDSKGIVVSIDRPGKCGNCGDNDWIQDFNVLDTWFSSALWPMSVFGWPEKTRDLEFYYPTSVLVTGYEILYLWVARMQMMGVEFMGKPPFKDLLIHGIVRDKSGKKMSKSLGNVIDPLEMMDKYGTDALRFSLMLQAHPGRDIPFAEESITGSRNFANKLWNSTRFVLMNLPERPPAGGYDLSRLSRGALELADQWILAEYQSMLAKVREKMGSYEIAAAADILYTFLWDNYCDWYVELAKIRLQGTDGGGKEAARTILVWILSGTLKMLHPFMPFITEELYFDIKSYSGDKAKFLLLAGAPQNDFDWSNPGALRDMGILMQAVMEIRSLRSQLNLNPGLKINVVAAGSEQSRFLVDKYQNYLKTLARIEGIAWPADGRRPPQSATAVAAGMSFFVPLEGLIDFAKERLRLEKELAKAEVEIKKIAQKVQNKDFLARAPQDEVALARSQHEAALGRQEKLKETLAVLSPS